MAKSVKVHDDTHRALKRMKGESRSKSMDEVIREMVRKSTGTPVEKLRPRGKAEELTTYLGG